MSGAIGVGAIGTFIIGEEPPPVSPSSVAPSSVSPPPVATAALAPPLAGATFYLEWGGDLILTPNGSVLMASGWDEVRERIIRRFLTNSALPLPDGTTTPPDYIFDPAYGLGAGALIDQNPDANWRANFSRRMREAVAADFAVAPNSVPSINITTPAIGTTQVYVGIQLISGQLGTFSLSFGG